MSSLTPRLKSHVEKATIVAKKDFESAKIAQQNFASKLVTPLNLQKNRKMLDIPSNISLTARLNKMVEKAEVAAKHEKEMREVREVHDLIKEGENEANQEISATPEYKIEHQDWYGVSDEVRYGPHDWEKRIDYEYHGTKDNGIAYYYDQISGVSVWNKPDDFKEPLEENKD